MDINTAREGTKKIEPGSVMLSDRPTGNEKLKHRKVPLNIRKHFYTVRVTKHWHRLLGEVMESLSLEIFKSHLDMIQSDTL